MYNEFRGFVTPLQGTPSCPRFLHFADEPGCSTGETYCSGPNRCMEIHDVTQGFIIEIHRITGWWKLSRKKTLEVHCQIIWVDVFRFLKRRWCFHLMWGDGNGNSMEMILWSDTSRPYSSRLLTGAESVMTRSRVCSLVWLGTSTCWVRLKQSKNWRNSAARQQEGVFKWMFMSPNINCIGRCSAEWWEEVVYLRNESWVSFGWMVDEKYSHEEWRLTFKCKAHKRGQFR